MQVLDSPAREARMQNGDCIVAIDGLDLAAIRTRHDRALLAQLVALEFLVSLRRELRRAGLVVAWFSAAPREQEDPA